MVRFLLDKEGSFRVEQYVLSPAVYFDHWALRVISEDQTLRARFSTALTSQNGTLMLSWLNLAEFTKVRNRGQAAGPDIRLNDLADTIVERVEALRETMYNDESFSALVRRLPLGQEIQRGTRYILRELSGTLLIDRGIKMTRNHGIDLMHSVVPVAYADLVLLDKHWEAQVEKIRARFLNGNLNVPLARVFSLRGNGLDRFLCEFEKTTSNKRFEGTPYGTPQA